ncbi:Acyl-CoA-binding protein, ACBP [Metarhizium robertsii ARSEF 23]|uniref:Acyl-CoA-binding protein, ACBP n=1 Tax=Metarhizium robertsii (strain ARSEF 23 / ATCC MYA-3075) TaxID=655844 RepID=E9F1G8_METRA|nr:Acyl-CoA-binding protein, ACBP [Metarhizium robertsii ARSEF 23]EFY98340.1 Acyl-CoA-binding protein, ACBP [Metarhizium robertsii ARSEF 23]
MSAKTSNPVFNNAANEEVQKLPGMGINLSNDQLLELYGYYKIATGCDITKEPAPGMFDIRYSCLSQALVANVCFAEQRKEKWRSWKAKVDEGKTAEQAQEKYIQLVEEYKKGKKSGQ